MGLKQTIQRKCRCKQILAFAIRLPEGWLSRFVKEIFVVFGSFPLVAPSGFFCLQTELLNMGRQLSQKSQLQIPLLFYSDNLHYFEYFKGYASSRTRFNAAN